MTAATIEAITEREIVTSRVYDAPRRLVYEAFTDPKHLAVWWGPNGFRTTTYEMDVRPGGKWRFIMHGPDGTDYDNRIVYTEVVPEERLAFDHGSDIDNDPNLFQGVITFEEQGKQTKVTLRNTLSTPEALQAVLKFGADELGKQTLDRLADYLPTMAA